MGFFSNEDLHSRLDSVLAEKPKLYLDAGDAGQLLDLHANFPNGCDVQLGPGKFDLHGVILLPSNTRIRGSGTGNTTLSLAPGSDCHIFTNVDYAGGGMNIAISDMRIVGNGSHQNKPQTAKSVTFACAIYLKRVNSVIVDNIDFFDIRQTAFHLTNSENIIAKSIDCQILGWSGVSTSNASNIYIIQATIADAGRDVMHSGIHMDGGCGVYIDAQVKNTTGNGIMLDSKFALLHGCVIKGAVEGCKRGVALSGAHDKPLSDVVISGNFSRNREVGIMISNASNVAVIAAELEGNGDYGILLQGRDGARNCTILDCKFRNNGSEIGTLGGSRANWYFPQLEDAAALFRSQFNQRSLGQLPAKDLHFVKGTPWFDAPVASG